MNSKMAVIHIEKANPEINGLYQFINREFLVRSFPEEMILVNREDDGNGRPAQSEDVL